MQQYISEVLLALPTGTLIISSFKLWSRFRTLESSMAYRQEDIAIVWGGLRACLDGLIQLGANGAVSKEHDRLNAYIENKAAGLSGKGERRGPR